MSASKARSKYILLATLVMLSLTSSGMSAQVSRSPVPQTGACDQLGQWDLVVHEIRECPFHRKATTFMLIR